MKNKKLLIIGITVAVVVLAGLAAAFILNQPPKNNKQIDAKNTENIDRNAAVINLKGADYTAYAAASNRALTKTEERYCGQKTPQLVRGLNSKIELILMPVQCDGSANYGISQGDDAAPFSDIVAGKATAQLSDVEKTTLADGKTPVVFFKFNRTNPTWQQPSAIISSYTVGSDPHRDVYLYLTIPSRDDTPDFAQFKSAVKALTIQH